MTAKKRVQKMPRIDIEDSVAIELANIPKEAQQQKLLITGFVVILETYDGHQKKLRVKRSHDLPLWSANGMIARMVNAFADDPDDDDDYNPAWYWEQ